MVECCCCVSCCIICCLKCIILCLLLIEKILVVCVILVYECFVLCVCCIDCCETVIAKLYFDCCYCIIECLCCCLCCIYEFIVFSLLCIKCRFSICREFLNLTGHSIIYCICCINGIACLSINYDCINHSCKCISLSLAKCKPFGSECIVDCFFGCNSIPLTFISKSTICNSTSCNCIITFLSCGGYCRKSCNCVLVCNNLCIKYIILSASCFCGCNVICKLGLGIYTKRSDSCFCCLDLCETLIGISYGTDCIYCIDYSIFGCLDPLSSECLIISVLISNSCTLTCIMESSISGSYGCNSFSALISCRSICRKLVISIEECLNL